MTRTPQTGTNIAAAVVAVLLLGLAGCGGASSGASRTAATDVSAAESVAASAAAGAGGDDGSGDAARFSDAEACAWLKKTLPKIEKAGDDVSAQLVLTLGLSTFFEQHGGLEHADGYAFDEATVRGCKPEHDVAIKKAGIKSIGNL